MMKPLLAAGKLITEFAHHLSNGTVPDNFTMRRMEREISYAQNEPTIYYTATAFLYAVKGDLNHMISTFEYACQWVKDASVGKNYLFALVCTYSSAKYSEVAIRLASVYPYSAYLNLCAAFESLRLGRRDNFLENFDNTIKLINDASLREELIFLRDFEDQRLSSAYDVSGCNQEQFVLISRFIHQILDKFKVKKYATAIDASCGGSYRTVCYDTSVEKIVDMNFALVDLICDTTQLDNCQLTPQFLWEEVKDNSQENSEDDIFTKVARYS
ncbi:hypothetical protein ACFX4S_14265 [Kosakonia sp. YIM B13605]|uniref:hypothetical protein n=1 Tax=Kosakonia TaxID=1330547 RepID=UPI0032D9AD2A